jgi:hypothetical protein
VAEVIALSALGWIIGLPLSVLILTGIADAARWYRKRRHRELPLSHAVMRAALRRFGQGEMPSHETAALTLAEEDTFRHIAAAEHAWIGDAVKGPQGETQ